MSNSGVARLHLVSHGMTEAMSAGLFPSDEPLNALGCRQIGDLGALAADSAVCGPELRTRQSAELAGLDAQVEPALADLNTGSWRGKSLDEVPPEELAAWLGDPASAPHGGESIIGLIDRVRGWLTGLAATPRRTVAVTHPAVIRSAILVALDAPAQSFWRIDIPPCAPVVLHHRPPGWTLRL